MVDAVFEFVYALLFCLKGLVLTSGASCKPAVKGLLIIHSKASGSEAALSGRESKV